MADPLVVSLGPPVVEQPVGHAVDRDVGFELVAVGHDHTVVEETLEKLGVQMSRTDELGWLPGCTGLSSSTCGRCTGSSSTCGRVIGRRTRGSATGNWRATNTANGGVELTSSPPRLAVLFSRRVRARSARAAAVLGLSSGFLP